MGPAADDLDVRVILELVVGAIAVRLDRAAVIAEKSPGRLVGAGAHVVMEHDQIVFYGARTTCSPSPHGVSHCRSPAMCSRPLVCSLLTTLPVSGGRTAVSVSRTSRRTSRSSSSRLSVHPVPCTSVTPGRTACGRGTSADDVCKQALRGHAPGRRHCRLGKFKGFPPRILYLEVRSQD